MEEVLSHMTLVISEERIQDAGGGVVIQAGFLKEVMLEADTIMKDE